MKHEPPTQPHTRVEGRGIFPVAPHALHHACEVIAEDFFRALSRRVESPVAALNSAAGKIFILPLFCSYYIKLIIPRP